jgi:hypothetical protein
MLAETAGCPDGLKIAPTLPSRGCPHGCGLRAMLRTDLAQPDPKPAGQVEGPREVAMLATGTKLQGAAATPAL